MEILRGRTGTGMVRLCSLFGHTRSAWYQRMERQMELAIEQDLVVGRVLEIRAEQPRIGTRKLHGLMEPFLLSHGIKMGRDALFSLLESRNLLVRRKKKKGPKTTDGTGAPRWPNLLVGLEIKAVHEAWATDITYVASQEGGWFYLMALVDLFSHHVVGWHLAPNMEAKACLAALEDAVSKSQGMPKGIVHHSDRGSQYRSDDYLKVLEKNHMEVSMCKRPQENGVSERLNGIIKNELPDGKPLPGDIRRARQIMAKTVEIYNTKRPHDSLGGLFPEEVHAGKQPLPPLWRPRKKKAEKHCPKEKKENILQETPA